METRYGAASVPEIWTPLGGLLSYDATRDSSAACAPVFLMMSEGKDGPMLRICNSRIRQERDLRSRRRQFRSRLLWIQANDSSRE